MQRTGQIDSAILAQGQGRCGCLVKTRKAAIDMGGASHADTALQAPFPSIHSSPFSPVKPGRTFFDTITDAGIANLNPHDRVKGVGVDQVFHSKIDRIHAQLACDMIKIYFGNGMNLR